VWEATAETEANASAESVWALWEDPGRWREWNEDIASAALEGDFALGSRARIRFKRSLPLRFEITELQPRRLFTDETRLPGARLGHEHSIQASDGGVVIRNRLYLDGPAERLYAALMGRRMSASVRRFIELERELAESGPSSASAA
jgi:hypothetical protein